jgi:hypothetical protein
MMEREASKQKFALAKSMFLEGQYEDALVLLDELSKEHPAVFNIEFTMLQCFQRLGRLEDVKELYALMISVYTNEKQQKGLKQIQEWITQQDGGNTDGLDDLQLDLNTDALDINLMGDLFENSTPKKKKLSTSSSTTHAVASNSAPWKVIAAVVVLGAAGAAAYLLLPTLLGAAPQFSASVILGLPHANLEGKFYRKSEEVSRTEMMGQVVITKKGLVYRIVPEAKKYSVASLKEMAGQSPLAEMSDFQKWIDANGGQKTGEETLYGYICDVYQAPVRMSPAMPPADTKIWYARDLKFPVKSETLTGGLLGKVVMFLKDIKVGTQPADLFEIPADYAKTTPEEIADLTAKMGFSPAAGAPPKMRGNAPDNSKNLNPADMEKLMKQLNIK